jgi:hypothetical protein
VIAAWCSATNKMRSRISVEGNSSSYGNAVRSGSSYNLKVLHQTDFCGDHTGKRGRPRRVLSMKDSLQGRHALKEARGVSM